MMVISRRSGGDERGAMSPTGVGVCLSAILALGATAGAALTPDRVLLVYNSQNAESLAVRNIYIAAHPGVLQFDLNDASLGTGPLPGSISRADYVMKIRGPLRMFLNNGGPTPRSQQVIAIATTRGLPAQIQGSLEFQLNSTFASLESELTLVQQDLEAAGVGPFSNRFSGLVTNPYARVVDTAIDTYSRANIETAKPFVLAEGAYWNVSGLTPGDMYLVCRIDSAPRAPATALQNIQALITRSQSPLITPCKCQALLDEWSCADQLDNDGLGAAIPAIDDFANAAALLTTAGVTVTHDATAAFIEGPEIPDATRQLLALGSYGENHSLSGCGENPSGAGTYLQNYANLHPASMVVAYESFGGNSLINGMSRDGQGQALDFIAAGGSFTVATVAEPFTVGIADMEMLVRNMMSHGLTFAEAAYTATPVLSWQETPVGDPLARVRVANTRAGEVTGDGVVNANDLAFLLGAWASADCSADFNHDGVVNSTDLGILLGAWG